jgi:hypothetical protein
MVSREITGKFPESRATHTKQRGLNGTISQITPNQKVHQISSRYIPNVEFDLIQRKQRAKVFVAVTHVRKGDETGLLEAELEGKKTCLATFC